MLNPFENRALVERYEAWYETTGRRADRLEKSLFQRLLTEFPLARTILEVGCGTGHFTRWLGERGLQPVGLDLSLSMLEEARHLRSPFCLQGDALMLPFCSASFDLVILITTLEFISDPVQALDEAIRVARQGLLLGVLNAQRHLGGQYKREGGPIWEVARFFTMGGLKRMIQEVAGKNPKVVWRTTLWPLWPGVLPFSWGGFIGIAVKLS
jgi:ubiquinone/menaquinone biosynthesis C-methylase UbiE